MKPRMFATLITLGMGMGIAGTLAPNASAGPLERRCAVAADAVIEAETPSGSISVETWDRGEVQLTATVQRGVDDVVLDCAPDRVRVRVVAPGNPMLARVQLALRVPVASRLHLQSTNAPIEIKDAQGSVRAETLNGDVRVSGTPREVEIRVVNGSVETSGGTVSTHVEAVNGAVSIRDAQGRVTASTVNGRLLVGGGMLERANLGTVSGTVSFEGGLASRGALEIETVSGAVELTLPPRLDADLRLSSFSGEIKLLLEDSVGKKADTPKPGHRRHWGPEKSVSFTMGRGGASIAVQTLSGSITVRPSDAK